MQVQVNSDFYSFDGSRRFSIADFPHKVEKLYKNDDHYEDLLKDYRKEIDELQSMMYAQDSYAMLLIFQAMDAAGKDGTIKHVMSGVNAHGVVVETFKRPTSEELDHDYMWRTSKALPERGRIGIFNRSYYEEVLVVRVHPAILTEGQRIPKEFTQNIEEVWQQRFEDIRNFEQYIARNGIVTMKFFLNVSQQEQRDRFLERINEPEKNWKFAEADVKEALHWDAYMKAYEEAINATAAPHAPWYVIPADDKRNMRLIVSRLILERLSSLKLSFPPVNDARREELEKFREMLEGKL